MGLAPALTFQNRIMVDFSPLQRPGIGPSLQAFQEAIPKGEEVLVHVDGTDFKVQAQGEYSAASGLSRRVAWVKSDVDTTGIFMQAMAQTYGARLSEQIAKTLGLEPAPGKALSTRVIAQALDMGHTGQKAMQGVDFMTQLDHSATASGRTFQRLAAENGLDPRGLDQGHRQWIDEQMQARFSEAAAQGQSPVSPELANSWLRGLMSVLVGPRT